MKSTKDFIHCEGGPFSHQKILMTPGSFESLQFSAKGYTGKYRKTERFIRSYFKQKARSFFVFEWVDSDNRTEGNPIIFLRGKF